MDAALVGMLLQSWQDGAVDDEIFSEQLADIAAAGKLRKNQILLTLRQRRAWDAPSLTTALDSLIASTTLSSSGDSELLSDDFRRQENAWFNDRNPTPAEEERRDVHAAAAAVGGARLGVLRDRAAADARHRAGARRRPAALGKSPATPKSLAASPVRASQRKMTKDAWGSKNAFTRAAETTTPKRYDRRASSAGRA